jgi:hypothetical protein
MRFVQSSVGPLAVVRVLSTVALLAALALPTVGRPAAAEENANGRLRVALADSSPTSITVAWTVGDEPAPFRFLVFLDGKRVASTTSVRHTIDGLDCARRYVVEVVLLDPAGGRPERAVIDAATTRCPARPAPTSGRLWQGAGAFVWHETDVSPEVLGHELRESGFAWVAVRVHDGLAVDPVQDDWARRFRAESGLPVGAWGVLRTHPEREATLALELMDRYGLDFYIANPEAEYKYSGEDGVSEERWRRSQEFVDEFRRLGPNVKAAVSSYCRADMQDLDWRAWSESEFAFLPQAYVNDFGRAASPAACAEGAAGFFDPAMVHPTVGVYRGTSEALDARRYTAMLADARTVGFSVYLAETRMTRREWTIFGEAIADDNVARHPRLLEGAQRDESEPETPTAPAPRGTRTESG